MTGLELASILWQSGHSLSNIIPEQCYLFPGHFPKRNRIESEQPLEASGLTLTIPEITPAQKIKAPGQFLKGQFSGAFPEHSNIQGHFLNDWPPAWPFDQHQFNNVYWPLILDQTLHA